MNVGQKNQMSFYKKLDTVIGALLFYLMFSGNNDFLGIQDIVIHTVASVAKLYGNQQMYLQN